MLPGIQMRSVLGITGVRRMLEDVRLVMLTFSQKIERRQTSPSVTISTFRDAELEDD